MPAAPTLRFIFRWTDHNGTLRPNHSLNRTFCGMRQLGFISFSPNCRIPQNAG
jgi:hypothetical protein